MTNLKAGFSPCPNDTFIFDALIHNKIDTTGLEFEPVIADVENLNNKAFNAELDITKLSFQTYFNVKNNYELLNSGSALGSNCGPILISKKHFELTDINNLRIAIPGENTTANLLLKISYPDIKSKQVIIFSEIENAILNEKVDAGVIIHESRFTYKDKGLRKIIDLGEYWENLTHCPIPLGCIVIRKSLNNKIKTTFAKILKNSVEFAFNNPNSGHDFIKANAQELMMMLLKSIFSFM